MPDNEIARVDGPLDDVNDAFHEGYDASRNSAEGDVPVFVVLADELIRFRGDERRAFPISPRQFHVVKATAHAPVAVYGAVQAVEGPIDTALRLRLERLRTKVREARGEGGDLDLVLEATARFLDGVLASGRTDRAALDAFAGELGPVLLRLTDVATQLQIEALESSVAEAIRDLSATEREALQVVVTGDHQARAKSLAMQYFRKRLGDPEGEERRVLYGEAITDPDEARELIGKNRLDRRIARAFFGEEKRLQRDVLADAATARLREAKLEPIG